MSTQHSCCVEECSRANGRGLATTMRRATVLLASIVGILFVFGTDAKVAFGQGTWTTKAPMSMARWGPGSGVVNGIVYVMGGNINDRLHDDHPQTNEAYDPSTNTWSTKAPMPNACAYRNPCGRYDFGVAVVGGILYAMAGGCPGAYCAPAVNQAYDPSSNSWTSKRDVPTFRLGLSAVAVGAVIYTFGGFNGEVLGTVEAYDTVTDTWTTKRSMLTPRVYAAASVVNGIIYVIGGSTSTSIVGTVEAYDPVTDTWTTKRSMPTPRALLAAGVIDGTIYSVGGFDFTTGAFGTVEAYNPLTDTWTTKASMPTARNALVAGVVNSTLYAVGGEDASGNPLATNEAFTDLVASLTSVINTLNLPPQLRSVLLSFANRIPTTFSSLTPAQKRRAIVNLRNFILLTQLFRAFGLIPGPQANQLIDLANQGIAALS